MPMLSPDKYSSPECNWKIRIYRVASRKPNPRRIVDPLKFSVSLLTQKFTQLSRVLTRLREADFHSLPFFEKGNYDTQNAPFLLGFTQMLEGIFMCSLSHLTCNRESKLIVRENHTELNFFSLFYLLTLPQFQWASIYTIYNNLL